MAITIGTRKNATPIECAYCGTMFTPWQWAQKTCSYRCGYSFQNARNRLVRQAQPRTVQSCVRCGADLSTKRRDAIYCTKKCKSMDHTFKKRGGTRLAGTARRRLIYERDGGKCYICDMAIAFDKFWIDHLIPVSRGGSSVESNLAVSCPDCNRRRSNKMGRKQHEMIEKLTHDR